MDSGTLGFAVLPSVLDTRRSVRLFKVAGFTFCGRVTKTREARSKLQRSWLSSAGLDMKREPVGPGEESVWDYPRPPRVEPTKDRVRLEFNGETIADTTRAQRMLETSHPPTYYIPFADCKQECFSRSQSAMGTTCEFKGRAVYYDIKVGNREERGAAWQYPKVTDSRFASITDCIAVYPGKMDACYVGDELARAQEGSFYGGWITDNIKGPFKGAPGTWGW